MADAPSQRTRLDAAVLTAEPGDPLFEVWADALVEAADPRGTLVSLSRKLERTPGDAAARSALEALVQEHTDDWCPGVDGEVLLATWRDGFIDALSFRPPQEEEQEGEDLGYTENAEDEDDDGARPGQTLRRLIDHPMAARLANLSVHCPISAEGNHGCWGDHRLFLDTLLSRDRPWLRVLELDSRLMARALEPGRPPELSFLVSGFMHEAEVEVGDLTRLWQRAPRLEHLALPQPHQATLGKVDAPALRTLVFGLADDAALQAIGHGNLPRLETLVVRVSKGQQVKALLESPALNALKHLALVSAPPQPLTRWNGVERLAQALAHRSRDEILPALLASPRLGQLETLDLGGLDASDADWEALAAAAPRLRGLKTLRLTSWVAPDGSPDDWLEDTVEQFRQPRYTPHALPIGRRLEGALPVRWMLVRAFLTDAPPADGWLGLVHGHEGFQERRG